MRQVVNLETGEITTWADAPAPPHVPATAEQNKANASRLLKETDWVYQPDVTNVDNTPHLLNLADFETFRLAVRAIAVNPTDGDLQWPVVPESIWSN